MEEQGELTSFWSAVILASILLAGTGSFFYFAGFFDREIIIVDCAEGEMLIEDNCVKVIEEDVIEELTDLEKFESYNQVSIYSRGIVTPNDYMQRSGEYLNDDGTDGVGRKIRVDGEIEDAYIYIKAGTNDAGGNFGSILEQYDTIFFYIKNGTYQGGHLEVSKSKFGQPSEFTEILFNLSDLPVATSLRNYRNGNFDTINLLDDLQEDRRVGALVNTERYGKIELLIIGYKCKGEQDSCNIY